MKLTKEKLENIWYYYKVPILVVLLVIAVGIYVFITSRVQENYNHHVAVISSAYYSDEQLNTLKTAFEGRYGSIGIEAYRIALGELNQDDIQISKLDADLRTHRSDILLLQNVRTFEESTNNLAISEPVPVSDIEYLKGLGFDDLYLVTRK